ncbi:alpha/beta hydrolase [Halorubellus sp. PRR65]|uniref:alpha/beta hydrolase n=1 Tax=Halorubellus sp. PRR65 TaxID=3098148 RepID=UPI002B263134|nr:alpha/beta hydrolase [Halorubellus sp. PRR65]
MRSTRRRVLRALGVAGTAGGVALAGCTEGESTDRAATGATTTALTTAVVDTETATTAGATTATDDGVLGAPDEETELAVVYRDVPFRDTEHGRLRLDYYRPRDAEGRVPLVVHVHGGAWAFGSKGGGRFARVPLDSGAAFASVGYRLSGTASYPKPVRDVVAALAWCREHATELGVDPDRVGVTGESAGGHLSTLVAAAPDVATFRPAGVSVSGARASCVVSVSGVYDFGVDGGGVGGALVRRFLGCEDRECEPQRTRASPVTYLDAGDAPALVYHGTADRVVPYEQAERYVEAASDAGASVSLVTGEGGGHVTPYAGDWGKRYERRQRAFLREHLF